MITIITYLAAALSQTSIVSTPACRNGSRDERDGDERAGDERRERSFFTVNDVPETDTIVFFGYIRVKIVEHYW